MKMDMKTKNIVGHLVAQLIGFSIGMVIGLSVIWVMFKD
jgi:hypothetical protein